MADLLPCPFCGKQGVAEHIANNNLWAVGCADCDCVGMGYPVFPRKAEAIAAWNTRAAPQLAADNARLREALAELVLYHDVPDRAQDPVVVPLLKNALAALSGEG